MWWPISPTEHCPHQKTCWEPNTPPHVITWYHDWFHKQKVAFPELNINRCNNCPSLFITVYTCNMKNYFHLHYCIVIWYILHRSSNFFKILIYWFKTTVYMWLLWWISEYNKQTTYMYKIYKISISYPSPYT